MPDRFKSKRPKLQLCLDALSNKKILNGILIMYDVRRYAPKLSLLAQNANLAMHFNENKLVNKNADWN